MLKETMAILEDGKRIISNELVKQVELELDNEGLDYFTIKLSETKTLIELNIKEDN